MFIKLSFCILPSLEIFHDKNLYIITHRMFLCLHLHIISPGGTYRSYYLSRRNLQNTLSPLMLNTDIISPYGTCRSYYLPWRYLLNDASYKLSIDTWHLENSHPNPSSVLIQLLATHTTESLHQWPKTTSDGMIYIHKCIISKVSE